MAVSVEEIRAQFPALNRTYRGQKVVYLDGPGGSQVCKATIDAVAGYMAGGSANLHGVFPTSVDTESRIAEGRYNVATFLGATPEEIAFGPNMTTLTLSISRALSRTWQPGDEIIVSELDHRSNVDPWILAAEDRGVTVKWLPVNTETFTLDLSELNELLSEKTRLVAVGLASNAVGTITDVRAIADAAHAVGAIVAVDAVHAAPHISIHRDQLDADILLCSAYKFFGPHVGIAAIRSNVFADLQVYKLKPAPSYFPDKLETGTQNHAGIAGVAAAIETIAMFGTGVTLREQLESAMNAFEVHESELANAARTELRTMPGVQLFAAPDDVSKTPTIAFRIEGMSPRQVCDIFLQSYSLFVADGDFYATTLSQRLGFDTTGGFVRAGLAPYTTAQEMDRFLEAIRRTTRAYG